MKFVERKLAIVLLDLIGSTAFVQKVGARRAAEWLQYHDRLTRSLLYKFEGREIDRSDGFMLSFERPIDAVNFALLYQQTIPPKTKLNTRIGIHYGVVVEVQQAEIYKEVGAKHVELEGVAKNIAARTMSLCRAGQVLLTYEAMKAVRHRTNAFTPKGTRYALAGLYRFKGVREPQKIYTVGSTIESLQPPPGNEKVKRLGGAKRIKSRLRDRQLKEHLWFLLTRAALIVALYLLSVLAPIVIDERLRHLNELDHLFWWVDNVIDLLEPLIEMINTL